MIFLDNARTTQPLPEVYEAMKPYLFERYGVPSGLYRESMMANEVIEKGEELVSKVLNADGHTIYFTSSGTEANNIAMRGVPAVYGGTKGRGKRIITTNVEHPSILASSKVMGRLGFDVVMLDVDEWGAVSLEAFEEALNDETVLVSLQMANHEVGTIHPVKEAIEMTRDRSKAFFHVDAAQAFGKIPIDVGALDVDVLTFSGHKFHGPKGVGCLVMKNDVQAEPMIVGETSTTRVKGGSENIPAIAGMTEAAGYMRANMEENFEMVSGINKALRKGLDGISDSIVNSPEIGRDPHQALPYIYNHTLRFIEGEAITLYMDMEGIAVSTGSACASWNLQANYVLTAMGRAPEDAHGSIRLSPSIFNNMDEVAKVLEVLPEIVDRLREISPLAPK